MSRLIDADNLESIKFHSLPYTHITPTDADAESYKRGWNDAIDSIIENEPTIEPERKTGSQLPSVQPEQQWVLVKEKLPEEDKDVLVTVHFLGLEQKHKSGWNVHIKPSYYVDIASHIDGEWSSASDEYKVARNRHIVIAWKELPDPYRVEGENG